MRGRSHILLRILVGLLVGGHAAATTAATVAHKNKGKNGPYAALDAGTDAGFAVGETACISVSEDEEVCAAIVRANAAASAVSLSDEDYAKVEKGMTVRLQAEPVEPVEPVEPSQEESPEVVEDGEKAEVIEAPVVPGRKWLDVAYVYGVALPINFRTVGFDIDSRTSGVGSPWESLDARTSSLVGIALTYTHPFNSRWALVTGLTYQFVPQKTVDVDFNPTAPTEYAEASSYGSLYALSADAQWYVMGGDAGSRFGVALLGGLRVLRSTASFTLESTGGSDSGTVAKVDSTLMAVALDLGANTELVFGKWRATLGAQTILPIAEFAKSRSGTIDLPDDAGDTDQDVDGLADAAEHKAGSVGINVVLGIGREL